MAQGGAAVWTAAFHPSELWRLESEVKVLSDPLPAESPLPGSRVFSWGKGQGGSLSF